MDVILLFALDEAVRWTAAHGGVRWVEGAIYQSALRRGQESLRAPPPH